MRPQIGRRPRHVPVIGPAGGDGAPAGRAELTLATFNIWFNEHHASERYRAIADLLAARSPDVVVLQEVTPAAWDVFSGQDWIREHYHRAAVVGGDAGNYGMALLSRLPLTEVTYRRLPSRLSRGFLRGRCGDLVVGNAHLDSGKQRARLRARQLRRIFGWLRRADDAVLLGDFNMRDTENHRIAAEYRDVWPALRPGEPGYTEDTDINLMRWDSKPKHRQVRFDRVLLKGDRWAATEIDLLGTAPISSDLPRVFPSDHFGLWCRLVRQGPVDGAVRRPTLLDRWKGVWWSRFRSSR